MVDFLFVVDLLISIQQLLLIDAADGLFERRAAHFQVGDLEARQQRLDQLRRMRPAVVKAVDRLRAFAARAASPARLTSG